MKSEKKVRVRFAPSPTGYLHIGGLRTALYNYLFARKNKGDFIIRLEDTDQKRFVKGAAENLLETLKECCLDWSEGPKLKSQKKECENEHHSTNYSEMLECGPCGPYVQSERLEIYRKYVENLVKQGKAYYCFCEPQRLEEMRKDQQNKKLPPMYDRYCLDNVSADEINEKLKDKCPYTIRMKIPRGESIIFKDIVRGKVEFKTENIDDQILLKSDGFPTYHLANVIDDHLMGITHVIRGEEWLPSTPKHILLYKAFGWEVPEFAHIPLLLSTDRKKLSKRQGDVSVESYLEKGYLPQALINFVALLGWNPGSGETQEYFSKKELIEKFQLEKVHKGGAVFDVKKLDWLNSQYIKNMSNEDLYEKILPELQKKDFYIKAHEECKSPEYVKKVIEVEKERMIKLSEFGDEVMFLFKDIFVYPPEMLKWKQMEFDDVRESLQKAKTSLDIISPANWTKSHIEQHLLEAAGDKRGDLLWPLRVALTGQQKSPSPFEVAWVVGKEETFRRIDRAISLVVS